MSRRMRHNWNELLCPACERLTPNRCEQGVDDSGSVYGRIYCAECDFQKFPAAKLQKAGVASPIT
jgi:RNase P subunit RPR2